MGSDLEKEEQLSSAGVAAEGVPSKQEEGGSSSYFEHLRMSKHSFSVFEFNKKNTLKYFSSLIVEKLAQVNIYS